MPHRFDDNQTTDKHEAGSFDGVKLTLRLSRKGGGATGSVTIAATGQRLELDDIFLLTGSVRMSPELRRILAGDGTLLVSADGRVRIFR